MAPPAIFRRSPARGVNHSLKGLSDSLGTARTRCSVEGIDRQDQIGQKVPSAMEDHTAPATRGLPLPMAAKRRPQSDSIPAESRENTQTRPPSTAHSPFGLATSKASRRRNRAAITSTSSSPRATLGRAKAPSEALCLQLPPASPFRDTRYQVPAKKTPKTHSEITTIPGKCMHSPP